MCCGQLSSSLKKKSVLRSLCETVRVFLMKTKFMHRLKIHHKDTSMDTDTDRDMDVDVDMGRWTQTGGHGRGRGHGQMDRDMDMDMGR
jgi:hypothetical protein